MATFLWVRHIDGGQRHTRIHVLQVDSNGDLYSTGFFQDIADFGTMKLSASDT
jgi:hypothetical protein